MKRPFAVIGFSCLLALVAASYWDAAAAGVMAVFLALCAVAAGLLPGVPHREAVLAALISGALAVGLYGAVTFWRVEPLARFDGRTLPLTGTVTDTPTVSGSSTVCILRVTSAGSGGGALRGTRVRLTVNGSAVQAFDTVQVTAKLSVPPSGGGFDSRRYYRAKGVYLLAKAAGAPVVTPPARRPLYAYAVDLRQYISGVLTRYVTGNWGALAAGILIGDVSQIPSRVKSDFTVTGITHLLAVSGTQTSLILQYMLLALGAARVRRRPAACVTAGVVAVFMAVTGFSASVMRAGLMSLLYLGAQLVGREADALNSLGFSVCVLCAANPFAATDVGLQLSCAATLGMITLSGRMAGAARAGIQSLPAVPRRLFGRAAGVMCETAGASLFTFPVIVLVFRRLSLVTPLSNLLEVPTATAVTLLAGLAALLAPLRIFGFLLTALGMLMRLLTAFMMWYAHLLAQIPFATVSTAYGFAAILLVFVVVAALVAWACRGRGGDWRVLAVCVSLCVVVGVVSHLAASDGVLTLAAVPVSAGSSAVLVRQGHAVVFELYGSGADYQVEQYLKARNVRQIDALILPGYDTYRVARANSLMDDIPIQRIFVPGAYQSADNRRTLGVSTPVTVEWQGVRILLQPNRAASALMARVTFGQSTALLTGHSAGDLGDYDIAPAALHAAVLFWGGGLSEDLARAAEPAYVLRAGAAQDSGGLSRLVALSCRVAGVSDSGAVGLLTRGNGKYLLQTDETGGLA